jgi:MFS family permease
MLAYTIWLYSLASAGAATSQSFGALLFWRAMVGMGLGGEWSAGAVLVAETWPAEWRVRATAFMQSGWALGYMLAAGVTAVVLPRFGWRALFLTGLAPALLAFSIRRTIREPALWKPTSSAGSFWRIFRPPLARKTWLASALSASVLFAYWGLFTWIPGFLSTPVSEGGAGLSLIGTSASVIPMQFGAFLGYLTFGFMADRLGRRPAFLLYVLASAALVPIYGWAPRLPGFRPEWLLALGPLVGFFGTGYFGLFGAMLAELYPSHVRGSGQGFTYNFGRALSAAAPFAIGAIADRKGLGAALGWNSGFFLLAAVLIFTLPAKPVQELG